MKVNEILSYVKSFDIADDRKCMIVDALNSKGPNFFIYAVGKNSEVLAANKRIGIDAIIDGQADISGGGQWNGIPLIHPSSAMKTSLVINCSTSIRPIDTLHWLQKEGFNKIVNYFELSYALNDDALIPDFVKKQLLEVENNSKVWQEIYDRLADNVSKKTFVDVLKFRLSADPKFMAEYSVRIDQQYMEDFMNYRNEVFIDAGGFDGDTTEAFAKYYPDYKKIIVFEPSGKNIEKLKRRTSNLRNIEVHEMGLSDKKETLSFDQNSGSASAISNAGSDCISVDRLDSLIHEPVSFIKMDLEGWEIPALKGCVKHIKEDIPKLAIAIYHNPEDIRRVFQMINDICDEYSLYLRHYTQGWSETILFFVKK